MVELYRAGRFAEAIPVARQLLADLENAFGPNHPEVATALNDLAAPGNRKNVLAVTAVET